MQLYNNKIYKYCVRVNSYGIKDESSSLSYSKLTIACNNLNFKSVSLVHLKKLKFFENSVPPKCRKMNYAEIPHFLHYLVLCFFRFWSVNMNVILSVRCSWPFHDYFWASCSRFKNWRITINFYVKTTEIGKIHAVF